MSTPPEHRDVLTVNAAFYAAFENQDLDAMSDVWDHADDVTCVHPGWRQLRGWGSISASWFALFGGPQELQFIVTGAHVHVSGDVAWVTCTENLLGTPSTQTVAATNVFRRLGDRWKLVHHHGSPVADAGLVEQ